MRLLTRSLGYALICFLAYSFTLLAAPPSQEISPPVGNGILHGQVINGTTNKPQPNVKIKLHVIQNSKEINAMTTQADGNGYYTFEKLPTDHTINYQVEGEYQNIVYYSSEPALFIPNNPETTLNLNVYESTTDNKEIYVTQMHYLLSFESPDIQIVEIFIVGNRGNQTYIGQNGQTFVFALPKQSQGVTFQNDDTNKRFIKIKDGYADTEPIVPGEESLSIIATYNVPYQGDAITLDVPLPADVATLSVMMQERGVILTSKQVEFASTRELQGGAFSIFRAATLPKGEILQLNLTGLNKITPSDEVLETSAPKAIPAKNNNLLNQHTSLWLILGLGVLAIVGVMTIYPYYRRVSEAKIENLATQRERLLRLLVRLDEEFSAGEVEESVYRQMRAKYKSELMALEN